MSKAILSIQLPRNGVNKDAYLRAESPSDKREDLSKLLTEMLRKPSDYDLSSHTYKQHSNSSRPKKAPPIIKGDDERVGDGEPREL